MYSVWYEKQTVIQFQPSYTVQFSGLRSMCDQRYLRDQQTESKLKGHVSLEVNFTFPMMPIWHVHLWKNYETQKTGWSLGQWFSIFLTPRPPLSITIFEGPMMFPVVCDLESEWLYCHFNHTKFVHMVSKQLSFHAYKKKITRPQDWTKQHRLNYTK